MCCRSGGEARHATPEDHGSQPAYTGTALDGEALDRLWVNLLHLGLLDELRYLAGPPCNLPFRSEVKAFLDHGAAQFAACHARGAAYRARHPGVEIFTMGCIVGEEYIRNFLRYNVRSMLSEDNLPALARQGKVVFSIVTDAAGEQRLRSDPLFAKLSEIVDVEFTVVPDSLIEILRHGHLVKNFYVLYGMLDHCSIYFAEGAGSHLFMIPVDCVVASGTLVNMANYRHQGYECCGGGNLVAETETFLLAIDQRFGSEGPTASRPTNSRRWPSSMPTTISRAQVIAAENRDFGRHPRELFWPVEGGVEIHSVFIHPLFTTAAGLARYRRKHFANIDYGMIPRLFTHPGPIKLMDPSLAYVNNFTAAHRRYETTGRSFTYEDFLRCHDRTYPVQKACFTQAQHLPCRLAGYATCNGNDVAQDVRDTMLCSASTWTAPTQAPARRRRPAASGLDEVGAGDVRPGKGLQPDIGLVGEEFVDRGRLARPVGNGVFVENDHAASRHLVPKGLQHRSRRLVEIAIEVDEREADAGIVVGERRDRFLDVAVDQLDARLERNEAIGIEDGDRLEHFLVKAGRVEAAHRLAGVGQRHRILLGEAGEALPIVEAPDHLGAIADAI